MNSQSQPQLRARASLAILSSGRFFNASIPVISARQFARGCTPRTQPAASTQGTSQDRGGPRGGSKQQGGAGRRGGAGHQGAAGHRKGANHSKTPNYRSATPQQPEKHTKRSRINLRKLFNPRSWFANSAAKKQQQPAKPQQELLYKPGPIIIGGGDGRDWVKTTVEAPICHPPALIVNTTTEDSPAPPQPQPEIAPNFIQMDGRDHGRGLDLGEWARVARERRWGVAYASSVFTISTEGSFEDN